MRHYETIFIVNPNLSEEEYGEILKKFRDLIDKSKGIMIKVEEWGKQKLAYQLMKFDSGFYVLFDYCGEAGMTVELERILKLDEKILNYQTIKLADQADPEALIQKEEQTRKEQTLKAAEAASAKGEESPEAGETSEAEEPANVKEVPADAEEVSAQRDEEPETEAATDKSGRGSVEAGEETIKADGTQEEDKAAQNEGEKEK